MICESISRLTTDQFIASFSALGTWFSGIMTFLAIGITYFLGTKSRRIIVRKKMNICYIFGYGYKSDPLISIKITNINEARLIIDSLSWRFSKSKNGKQRLLQVGFDPHTTKLPVKLEFGDSADILINFNEWCDKVVADCIKNNMPLPVILSISAEAYTSTGKIIKIKPGKDFVGKIHESYIEKIKGNKS